MNIGMIRINRPPFLAEDALLYFLGQATSSSALRERPLFLAGADPRPTSRMCQIETFRAWGLSRAISINGLRRKFRVRPFMECASAG
jgi:hypothetical protein